MSVNFSKPSFGAKFNVSVKKEPEQIIQLINLSINPNIKITDRKNPYCKDDSHLCYTFHTADEYSESLKQFLKDNDISFYEIA